MAKRNYPKPAPPPPPTKPAGLTELLGTADPQQQAAAVQQLHRLTFSLLITYDARDGDLDFSVLGGRGKPVGTGMVLDMLEMTRRRVLEIERQMLKEKSPAAGATLSAEKSA